MQKSLTLVGIHPADKPGKYVYLNDRGLLTENPKDAANFSGRKTRSARRLASRLSHHTFVLRVLF